MGGFDSTPGGSTPGDSTLGDSTPGSTLLKLSIGWGWGGVRLGESRDPQQGSGRPLGTLLRSDHGKEKLVPNQFFS